MGKTPRLQFSKAALTVAVSSIAILTAAPIAAAQSPDQNAVAQAPLNIPAGPLNRSILAISDAFGVDILAPNELVSGKTASAVSGATSAENALNRALAGSGLTYSPTDGAFVIVLRAAQTQPLSPDAARIPAATNETTRFEDTVVVTGSRIERTAVNAPSPIDVVTAEEISRLGLTDVTEALRFVPALNQSVSLTTPAFDGRSSFAGGPSGSGGLGTLNLRGLGPERTLVLVNGRRHVGGVTGQATVDVTSIPAALIERVEVLTGGGSSIYGADAVSGVVNYIIRDDFEGLEYQGNYSIATEGEGAGFFGSLTLGTNFDGDRGNIVFNAEYQRQNSVTAADRPNLTPRSSVDFASPGTAALTGVGPDAQIVLEPDANFTFFPSAGFLQVTPLGSVPGAVVSLFNGGPDQISGIPIVQSLDTATGALSPFNPGVFSTFSSFASGGDGAAFGAFDPIGDLIPNVDRYTFNAFANYDILPDVLNTFVEVKYTFNESESRVLLAVNIVGLPIAADNVFIPEAINDQVAALNGLDLGPDVTPGVGVSALLSGPELNRGRVSSRETFRAVGGIHGELSSAFKYELSANYGRTDTRLEDNGEPLLDRFFAGVDAIEGPNGTPICRSDIDPATPFPTAGFPSPAIPGFNTFSPGDGSCQPINLFGVISPEAADFFLTSIAQTFELEQFVVNGTVTGNSEDYFNLPAGGVGYAVGFEYRDESSQFAPDSLQVNNLGFLSAFSDDLPVAGSFDVIEGFAEVNVPLLADLPVAEKLDFDASVRVADYSTVGTTASFAFGSLWQPVDDLRLRVSFNRAVRAPNVGELFTPQLTSPSQIVDPCSPDQIEFGTSSRAANCAAFVPAGFTAPISGIPFTLTEIEGGNPNLAEETADAFTVGFVYTPSFIPGLSIVSDYYDIDIQDAIVGAPGLTTVANNCVDAPTIDNFFCDAVERDPATGDILSIGATALNIAGFTSRGIDYQVAYNFDFDSFTSQSIGDVSVSVAGTYLIERENVPFADFPETVDILDGEIDFPEHFINFNLGWRNDKLSADYGFTYRSSTVLAPSFTGVGVEDVAANPGIFPDANTGSAFVHYIGASYSLSDQLDVSVIVNNLTNIDQFEGPNNLVTGRPVSAIGQTVQFGIRGRF
ncbi:MAG: TonB-dependent receptor [Pseudomonadota bacterium]